MAVPSLKRSFIQRILAIPATRPPRDEGAWSVVGRQAVLDLARLPELSRPGGAVRLEGKGLPQRLLVVRGEDGSYHASRNRCRHFGRRLDPVPGTGTVQRSSVNKATYDLEGSVLSGPAWGPVAKYRVQVEGGKLVVSID